MMDHPIIIRLYQPDAEGICDYEDETGEWIGGDFMPLAALAELGRDPYGYFEAYPKEGDPNVLTIGRRVEDQRHWGAVGPDSSYSVAQRERMVLALASRRRRVQVR